MRNCSALVSELCAGAKLTHEACDLVPRTEGAPLRLEIELAPPAQAPGSTSTKADCPKEQETSLLVEVAERTWSDVERARAEEALRESEGRARLLLAELRHRVRNILAMIRSLVTRTASEEMSAFDYAQHLAGRLDAVARTQAILTSRPGEGIEIEDLVREELLAQAPAEDRFHLEGPAVLLSPKAAEVLTLAVHELATNSIKYGSLGADGELSITWDVEQRDAEKWLTLVWEESGVENSGSASGCGFGTELITKRVPYELGGTGTIEFEGDGMRAIIAFPLRDMGSILETGSMTRQEQRA